MSEAQPMMDVIYSTPMGVAHRLAGYMRDPSAIRSYCVSTFGPEQSPSLERIRAIVEERASNPGKPDRRDVGEPNEWDAADYRMPGIVRRSRAKLSKTPQKAKPKSKKAKKANQPRPANTTRQLLKVMKEAFPSDGLGVISGPIVRAVAREFGSNVDELRSKNRVNRLVAARAVCIKLLRDKDPKRFSFPAIGRILGGRDHSTIIHGYQHFDVLSRKHPDLPGIYERLHAELIG